MKKIILLLMFITGCEKSCDDYTGRGPMNDCKIICKPNGVRTYISTGLNEHFCVCNEVPVKESK